jgi:hypothetical protein
MGSKKIPNDQSPYSYQFQKELINRQNCHISIVDGCFRPDPKFRIYTNKVWSKYDKHTCDTDDRDIENISNKNSMRLIEQSIKNGPRQKYNNPILESHR